MAIRLHLDRGFQNMIKNLDLSEKDSKRIANSCIRQSAQIMQSELKNAMMNSDLSPSLANRMPPFRIEEYDGKFSALVGFIQTPYRPRNLSDYHKAMFANYGTPNRSKHGKERARSFIPRAKRTARPIIRNSQKEAFRKIIERI